MSFFHNVALGGSKKKSWFKKRGPDSRDSSKQNRIHVAILDATLWTYIAGQYHGIILWTIDENTPSRNLGISFFFQPLFNIIEKKLCTRLEEFDEVIQEDRTRKSQGIIDNLHRQQ